ncbi:hypothetical protein COHA_002393 [Chlorella ohadii]|uniref:RmlD-like substrate binding domain-containing protein n=1 Tax=Chlorella ohadii TaxID=2649997 RepID=A0AAD5DX81_9CHLO|nr:hypothetical protein COHA_002393 [Chlorella ohadii]
MTAGTVLVTGASGYAAQFVVQDYAQRGWQVGATYWSGQEPKFDGNVKVFKVDLASGEGLQSCLDALGPLTAVINCAAQAAPAACEGDGETAARAINIPTQLLAALESHAARHGSRPALVHLSTDHVYEGSSSMYREEAELRPVNKYGRSKADAEAAVAAAWPGHHVILRPSIIFGPPPPNPTRRGQFLQSIDANLAAKKPSTFFDDEWRTPTYVGDLVAACCAAVERCGQLPPSAGERIINVGGPQRINRVDMALALCRVRGYDLQLVQPGSAASVPRTCATPADISMDTSRLQAVLGVQPTPFEEALRQIFAAEK